MVRDDRSHVAETLRTSLDLVSGLAVLLHPFLPFSTERLWAQLGHEHRLAAAGWQPTPVPAGRRLSAPEPLYRKLEPPTETP